MKKHLAVIYVSSILFSLVSVGHAHNHGDDMPTPSPSGEQAHKDKKMGMKHDRLRVRHEKRMEEYLMSKVDTNQDGLISYDEFMANAKSRFETSDLDGDGAISSEERKETAEIMRKKHIEAMRNAKSSMKNNGRHDSDDTVKAKED